MRKQKNKKSKHLAGERPVGQVVGVQVRDAAHHVQHHLLAMLVPAQLPCGLVGKQSGIQVSSLEARGGWVDGWLVG